MKLSEVLDFLGIESKLPSCELRDLRIDSRQVKTGDLFCAVPGYKSDGRDYIAAAINAGAGAVIAEAPCSAVELQVEGLQQKIQELAAFFYEYPSKYLKVIGVTGTNGKTSCSHYIAQILAAVDISCGIMGTLGNGLLPKLQTTQLTTSDACTVHRQFAEFKAQAVPYVAMEVSSHALAQGRLRGINFDTAIFTNLTQDHLDYHVSMHDYFAAKATLFTDYQPKNCIINLDDHYAPKLINLIDKSARVISYSIKNTEADVYLDQNILHTPWGTGVLRTSLIGNFNLSNVLACIAACGVQGLALQLILDAVSRLSAVAGRMQRVIVDNPNAPIAVVDYAHTPDALKNALQALAEYREQHKLQGKIYCIFGCGGDRDRSKRPLMLQAALSGSDQVIITQDNPRTEDPAQIVDDICRGQSCAEPILSIELDRARAIANVINAAQPQDIILIAGKGHEDYQIIGEQKLPFSDVEVAQRALNLRSRQYA